MGSVKFETRNDGRGQREWDYVSLSEASTIAKLIMGRSKQDESFYPTLFAGGGITESDGVFPFSEPVLVTYIDLDWLIDHTTFTPSEKYTLDRVMRGYTFSDLEQQTGKSRKTFSVLFDRACRRIKETNDKHWAETYSRKFCLHIKS